MATRATRPSCLTVGDGDLSYSVALTRCFPGMDVVATTFPLEDELVATYAASARNLRLLGGTSHCTVQHGVDATALGDRFEAGRFDHVIFNHPHLGLDDLHQTELHAQRHRVLIAHFLASATRVCKIGGHIHPGSVDVNRPTGWSRKRRVEWDAFNWCTSCRPRTKRRSRSADSVICSGVPPKLSGNAENVFAIYTRWVYMVMSIGGHTVMPISAGVETVLTWCGRR